MRKPLAIHKYFLPTDRATKKTEREKERKEGRQNEWKKRRNQGRIHGKPVADGWAGALMRKPIAIQKCDGRTDQHGKVQTVESLVRD